MKVLILAPCEPGGIYNGPSIILTHTAEAIRQRQISLRVGVLQDADRSGDHSLAAQGNSSVAFRVNRRCRIRNSMIRAACGGPLLRTERAFLALCAQESRKSDVALWLGSSWHPISLRLPRVCACPVLHHPTDSIALSEVNRLPTFVKSVRIAVARNLERRVLRAGYTTSIYNSPKDADFARSLVPEVLQSRVVALPCCVDTDLFYPAASKPTAKSVRIVFSGVMNYRPNVDAAVSLVREVLPHVRADIQIRIVGRDPAPEVEALQAIDERITVTGAVPDMASELRAADLFVAPMVSGNGILNKVLEAMACGLPLVTTPIVAENFRPIPGGMLVADSPEAIAHAIDSLAMNMPLRRNLAEEAVRSITGGMWSWPARGEKLLALLASNSGQDGSCISTELDRNLATPY